VLKRKFSAIIQKGWNKEIEIKASSLFAKSNFGPKSVKNVLGFIRSLESIEIHYMVVNKTAIENESFRNAPYGIAYNYFAGHLLEHIIFDNKVHDFQLIYDERNKETHKKKNFEEYLQTKLNGDALIKSVNLSMQLQAGNSNSVYGLRGVDFIAWSIFRKFEKNDSRFFDLFKERISIERKWYV